jgi:hypothetical protein
LVCTRARPLTVIKGYVYTLHRSESDPAKAAKLDVINDVVGRFSDARARAAYASREVREAERLASG